jgi:UDP-N-acetylglucosamine--dolichyl-phosphate N-acetylglucosaminephosphotransferase
LVTAINPIVGVAASALAAFTSYLVARYLAGKFASLGISGVDVHKPDRPVTAEMGGLAVLFGLAVGSAIFLGAAFPQDGTFLAFVAGASTTGLVGVVGIVDDLFDIRQRYKPLMIVAATIPLMLFLWSRGSVYIPIIGYVEVGLLYPLVAVPLAVTTSANFTNMLAGFNGLEAGMAVISLGTLALLSAATGHSTVAMLSAILTVAYFGFLVLNWYPARIFPGDTGTLTAGAAVAVIGLLSRLEFVAVVLSIPAAMDFTLKALRRRPFSGRKIHGNAVVEPDGTLKPAEYPTLVHAFMKVSPIKERGLVLSILAMQALFALVATIVTLGLL